MWINFCQSRHDSVTAFYWHWRQASQGHLLVEEKLNYLPRIEHNEQKQASWQANRNSCVNEFYLTEHLFLDSVCLRVCAAGTFLPPCATAGIWTYICRVAPPREIFNGRSTNWAKTTATTNKNLVLLTVCLLVGPQYLPLPPVPSSEGRIESICAL